MVRKVELNNEGSNIGLPVNLSTFLLNLKIHFGDL
ncbi:hypothetical protein GGR31_002428 [Mesonia maritima]|uniref:Uncharacterized protein n=1 Tax=Mesonia maritima TaxID=1793873 RepID=A0ABU1K808_9FLAO|nr:hypothetical protein [Mesonia maritima]